MHLFHQWGKWFEVLVEVVRNDGSSYTVTGQRRWCAACNKKQVRTF